MLGRMSGARAFSVLWSAITDWLTFERGLASATIVVLLWHGAQLQKQSEFIEKQSQLQAQQNDVIAEQTKAITRQGAVSLAATGPVVELVDLGAPSVSETSFRTAVGLENAGQRIAHDVRVSLRVSILPGDPASTPIRLGTRNQLKWFDRLQPGGRVTIDTFGLIPSEYGDDPSVEFYVVVGVRWTDEFRSAQQTVVRHIRYAGNGWKPTLSSFPPMRVHELETELFGSDG